VSVYAYVCSVCKHLASRHLLVPAAPSVVDGPYACTHPDCHCEIDQRTPLLSIDKGACGAMLAKERAP
jgi:hypothetical protein